VANGEAAIGQHRDATAAPVPQGGRVPFFSIMFLSTHSAIRTLACGSIHVLVRGLELNRALPSTQTLVDQLYGHLRCTGSSGRGFFGARACWRQRRLASGHHGVELRG